MRTSAKHTIKTQNAYFLTLTVEAWVDVFSRKNHREALLDSIRYCQAHKGLIVYAFVVMTNHVHLLVNTHEPFELKNTIRDLKKFTSKHIIQLIREEPESRREWMLSLFSSAATTKHKTYKFWKAGNHAIELQTERFTWDKINYIHNNPVEAGFVMRPQDWLYSSAVNYFGGEGLLQVECITRGY